MPRTPAPEAIARAAVLEDAYDRERKEYRRPLDEDERQFIFAENLRSKLDYGHFAECYVKVNKGGQTLEPLYPLWESQRLILDELARLQHTRWQAGHPDGLLFNCLKARQLGCSTIVQSLVAHRVVTHANVRALIASDTPDNTGSDGLFGMLELVVEHLPWWMVPPIKFHTKDKHIHFENGSRVRTEAGKSMKGGLTEKGGSKGQLGRSKTYGVAHLSELSTWENAGQIDDALMPALPVDPMTFVGLESTAKGRANWWSDHWRSSVRGRTRFTCIFIPWYAERSKYWLPAPGYWTPSVDTLQFAARATLEGPKYLHTRVDLTREQLYWYEQRKLEFIEKGALYKFLEEYCATPEEAFQYSGRSIFPLAVQERVKAQAKPMLAALEVKARSELAQMQATELAEAGRAS